MKKIAKVEKNTMEQPVKDDEVNDVGNSSSSKLEKDIKDLTIEINKLLREGTIRKECYAESVRDRDVRIIYSGRPKSGKLDQLVNVEHNQAIGVHHLNIVSSANDSYNLSEIYRELHLIKNNLDNNITQSILSDPYEQSASISYELQHYVQPPTSYYFDKAHNNKSLELIYRELDMIRSALEGNDVRTPIQCMHLRNDFPLQSRSSESSVFKTSDESKIPSLDAIFNDLRDIKTMLKGHNLQKSVVQEVKPLPARIKTNSQKNQVINPTTSNSPPDSTSENNIEEIFNEINYIKSMLGGKKDALKEKNISLFHENTKLEKRNQSLSQKLKDLHERKHEAFKHARIAPPMKHKRRNISSHCIAPTHSFIETEDVYVGLNRFLTKTRKSQQLKLEKSKVSVLTPSNIKVAHAELRTKPKHEQKSNTPIHISIKVPNEKKMITNDDLKPSISNFRIDDGGVIVGNVKKQKPKPSKPLEVPITIEDPMFGCLKCEKSVQFAASQMLKNSMGVNPIPVAIGINTTFNDRPFAGTANKGTFVKPAKKSVPVMAQPLSNSEISETSHHSTRSDDLSMFETATPPSPALRKVMRTYRTKKKRGTIANYFCYSLCNAYQKNCSGFVNKHTPASHKNKSDVTLSFEELKYREITLNRERSRTKILKELGFAHTYTDAALNYAKVANMTSARTPIVIANASNPTNIPSSRERNVSNSDVRVKSTCQTDLSDMKNCARETVGSNERFPLLREYFNNLKQRKLEQKIKNKEQVKDEHQPKTPFPTPNHSLPSTTRTQSNRKKSAKMNYIINNVDDVNSEHGAETTSFAGDIDDYKFDSECTNRDAMETRLPDSEENEEIANDISDNTLPLKLDVVRCQFDESNKEQLNLNINLNFRGLKTHKDKIEEAMRAEFGTQYSWTNNHVKELGVCEMMKDIIKFTKEDPSTPGHYDRIAHSCPVICWCNTNVKRQTTLNSKNCPDNEINCQKHDTNNMTNLEQNSDRDGCKEFACQCCNVIDEIEILDIDDDSERVNSAHNGFMRKIVASEAATQYEQKMVKSCPEIVQSETPPLRRTGSSDDHDQSSSDYPLCSECADNYKRRRKVTSCTYKRNLKTQKGMSILSNRFLKSQKRLPLPYKHCLKSNTQMSKPCKSFISSQNEVSVSCKHCMNIQNRTFEMLSSNITVANSNVTPHCGRGNSGFKHHSLRRPPTFPKPVPRALKVNTWEATKARSAKSPLPKNSTKDSTCVKCVNPKCCCQRGSPQKPTEDLSRFKSCPGALDNRSTMINKTPVAQALPAILKKITPFHENVPCPCNECRSCKNVKMPKSCHHGMATTKNIDQRRRECRSPTQINQHSRTCSCNASKPASRSNSHHNYCSCVQVIRANIKNDNFSSSDSDIDINRFNGKEEDVSMKNILGGPVAQKLDRASLKVIIRSLIKEYKNTVKDSKSTPSPKKKCVPVRKPFNQTREPSRLVGEPCCHCCKPCYHVCQSRCTSRETSCQPREPCRYPLCKSCPPCKPLLAPCCPKPEPRTVCCHSCINVCPQKDSCIVLEMKCPCCSNPFHINCSALANPMCVVQFRSPCCMENISVKNCGGRLNAQPCQKRRDDSSTSSDSSSTSSDDQISKSGCWRGLNKSESSGSLSFEIVPIPNQCHNTGRSCCCMRTELARTTRIGKICTIETNQKRKDPRKGRI